MMLFKLSLGNLRKSMRDYAIYFFTMIIGVSIFYVFNAIGTQTSFLKISKDTRDIVELLKTMLSGVSVFVSVTLGLLIVYASRFLMKRRNKEFALYLLLGLGKGKISAILLIETIFIGLISLAAGLVIGIGLSQLMSALVANLFEADMTDYTFTVSGEAILKTIVYFGIIYIVVMLFNSFMIGKCRLIDLIQSGRKSEKLKLKNPVLCVILFLISVCGLAWAYYNVGWNYNELTENKMYAAIAIGAAATFLIFWSVSGMLLRILMSMKGVYYRNLNSFTFRQISSKVNTMVVSMTVICLMLFVTICALSASFSIRNSMNDNLKKLCPADAEITVFSEKYFDSFNSTGICSEMNFDVSSYFDEYVNVNKYHDEDFTIGDFAGKYADEIIEASYNEDIISLSDYNALMKLYGKKQLSLNENEYIILCNYSQMTKIRNKILSTNKKINVFGHELTPKYSECADGFIDISSNYENTGIFVVADSVIDKSCTSSFRIIGNYKAKSDEEKEEIDDKLSDEFTEKFSKSYPYNEDADCNMLYNINTKAHIAAASIGLGAIVTFLGLYIGLVFLITCAAILALKELSDSVDSIPRYEMLRKIGADESDISKSLFRQTGIFFFMPLLVAIIHSIFGMKFALYIIEMFGTQNLTKSVIFTGLIILFIYGGYFLITYFCSKSIIKKNK